MPADMTMITAITGLELAGLLQLASPALPIGAFSYSQGLEAAIDAGLVQDAASAQDWIGQGLEIVSRSDAVLLVRQCQAWSQQDLPRVSALNDTLLALRESAEFRLESEQMGSSLARLARDMEWGDPLARQHLLQLRPTALVTAYAYAITALGVAPVHGATAWLYSWVENQVAAAIKAIPLGQVAGQRILFGLRGSVSTAAQRALSAADDEISTFAPMQAILSSRHETQYSRLFRS